MKPQLTELAANLGFPEGPVVMPDGSVIIVEIAPRIVSRIWPDGHKSTISTPGGGPNGLALGPDGNLYLCNSGGFHFENRDSKLIPALCLARRYQPFQDHSLS